MSDGNDFHVACYFTRVFSSGLDEAKSLPDEKAAMTFAKKCVKEGRGTNPHALVDNHYEGIHRTVGLTKSGRLQVKARKF
jgi:hypothetical protein